MSDNGNLVISHMIHRALPDTYLKFKSYQDFKHREKSKVNFPRTQKVGAEKGDSEPAGSPGTLTPHAHRHTRRLPGTTPWETLRGYTLANRMWPPWSLQFNGFLHGETEGKDNRVSWAVGSSQGYVSCVLLRCQDRGGEKNWLSALKSPSPFFHGWQNLHSDSLKGPVFISISTWFGGALNTLDFTL